MCMFKIISTLLFCVYSAAVSQTKKPNVLLIIVDDLRDSLGCYGKKEIHSPAIDLLAEKGTLFTRAYCQFALCGPSRASFFTASYPQTIKVFNNRGYFRDHKPKAITIPSHFKENGYITQGIGKILHDTKADTKSWTHERLFEKKYVYAGKEFIDKVAGIDGIHKSNNLLPLVEGPDVPDNAYRDGMATEDALRSLKKFKDSNKPFFLMVGYHKPHSPFNAPKKYWDLYDRQKLQLAKYQKTPTGTSEKVMNQSRYLRSFKDMPKEGPWPEDKQRLVMHAYHACISYIDAQVAKLLNELKAQGLDKNTIVALTSDHGYQLGEHGLWCKHTNFEGATKVPLIIFDPRLKPEHQGRKVDNIVELIDLAPTLWDLSGLAKAAEVDGKSFKKLLTENSKEFTIARSRYHRAGTHGFSIRVKNFRYTRWIHPKTKKTVYEELYDYKNDPLETRNFVENPEYSKVLQKLKKLWNSEITKNDTIP